MSYMSQIRAAGLEVANPLENLPAWKREHDACGVVMVSSLNGKPNRGTMDRLLEAGSHLSHRGAVAADGKTGDGAGIVTQIPQRFFRRILNENAVFASAQKLAIGQFFMSHDTAEQQRSQEIVEKQLEAQGFRTLLWRDVPIRMEALGEIAANSMPAIKQAVLDTSKARNMDRSLYIADRTIAKAVRDQKIPNFYTCSLSGRIIDYKGMILAQNLPEFFTDLEDPDYETLLGILHQRYSTNTTPTWSRSQPYSKGGSTALAHNGEINTLNGDVNFISAIEAGLLPKSLRSLQASLLPLIDVTGSDSSQLNDVFAYLVNVLGLDATQVMRTLVPGVSDDHAFTAPWDGPAAIAYTDGRRKIGIRTDRNGLRPVRVMETKDGYIIAGSETGMVHIAPENVARRFQLGPGQTIEVDLKEQRIIYPDEVAARSAAPTPIQYLHFDGIAESLTAPAYTHEGLRARQIAAGYTHEELSWIEALATGAEEAVSSMGDDTKVAGLERLYELAVLGDAYIPLHRLARQAFAQVTNPPIDPLRERQSMNLDVYLTRPSITNLAKNKDRAIALKSPVLTGNELRSLRKKLGEKFVKDIDATFTVNADPNDENNLNALETALDRIIAEAQAAYEKGQREFVVTDEHTGPNKFPVPMMLVVSAMNKHFIKTGARNTIGIHARSAEVMDTHSLAMLLACGATTVNPYLAFRTIADEANAGHLEKKVIAADKSVHIEKISLEEAVGNFKKGMDKGLLKIMSKMGIGVLASYVGGYNFEMLGLGHDVINKTMPGVTSRVGGYNFQDLQLAVMQIHDEADRYVAGKKQFLPAGSRHRAKPAAPHKHATNIGIKELRASSISGDYETYLKYARAHLKVNDIDPNHEKAELRKDPTIQPHNFRDLLAIRRIDGEGYMENPILKAERPQIPDDVESIRSIVKSYNTGAMSLGALSPEAHETLTIAMNRLGAKSDCGEGGEFNNGHISKIRQLASGRFGATAEYLTHPDVEEIEIKVAQGAKPGEGGQLPGLKVSGLIARLRHSTENVTLISPPPHHDIYSIEDLAQLIYDLKQINPKIKVAVKLVSQSGVGVIASGVAKAGADIIHCSGSAGGTGAAAVTSLMYGGLPPEIGVSEIHKQLTEDGLRSRVLIRADGGLKTALDSVKIKMCGADEVGFGTQALIAEGCVMMGGCHLNTCSAGIATQDPELRKMFEGKPEHVMNYMLHMAREEREILHAIGAKTSAEIVGRMDLFEQIDFPNRIDLSELITPPSADKVYKLTPNISRYEVPDTLDQRILAANPDLLDRLKSGERVIVEELAVNTDRSVGARLTWEIMNSFGMNLSNPDPKNKPWPSQFKLSLRGSAGQSLGFSMIEGMEINLTGDANDYVGKSLSGGRIIVRPYECERNHRNQAIIGNTVLYGATKGKLFAAGLAGERYAVRNSGAKSVVEGTGSNACNYMTGGRVVILGDVGDNFAAGMSGGEAFVWDPNRTFHQKLNEGTAIAFNVTNPIWQRKLHDLITEHHDATGSVVAKQILDRWHERIGDFRMVMGKDRLPTYPDERQPLRSSSVLAAA